MLAEELWKQAPEKKNASNAALFYHALIHAKSTLFAIQYIQTFHPPSLVRQNGRLQPAHEAQHHAHKPHAHARDLLAAASTALLARARARCSACPCRACTPSCGVHQPASGCRTWTSWRHQGWSICWARYSGWAEGLPRVLQVSVIRHDWSWCSLARDASYDIACHSGRVDSGSVGDETAVVGLFNPLVDDSNPLS